MGDTEFKEKIRSLSFPRKLGNAETKKEVADGRVVATTTEHWNGKQDATVFPDVIRRGARTHGTGKKKGQVAEIRTMDRKERKERYGDGNR